MVQKNKKLEQSSTNHNQEIEGKGCRNLYKQVHFDKEVYTCGLEKRK